MKRLHNIRDARVVIADTTVGLQRFIDNSSKEGDTVYLTINNNQIKIMVVNGISNLQGVSNITINDKVIKELWKVKTRGLLDN